MLKSCNCPVVRNTLGTPWFASRYVASQLRRAQTDHDHLQNRWILVEFIPCTALSNTQPSGGLGAFDVEKSSKQIWAALKQSVITHFGDTGWGAVGASLTGACSDRHARAEYGLSGTKQ